MADVVILKFINGNEVFARKHESLSGAKYSHLRIFQVYQNERGETNSGLIPFLFSNPDAEVQLNVNTIICELPCPVALERSYNEAVSGIALA